MEIALPIGISFFTFQKISYVLDVYRKTTEPADCFSDLSDRYVYYHVKSIGDMDQDISERDIVILESTVLELPFLNRGFMPLVLSEFEKMRPPFFNGGSDQKSSPPLCGFH